MKQLPRVEEADPTATTSRLQLPFVAPYGTGNPTHAVDREPTAHEPTSHWTRTSIAEGRGRIVFPDVVDQFLGAITWLNEHELRHFAVHLGNIVVRDGRLLFTDVGPALHHGFGLTVAEEACMLLHEGFDHDTALMHPFHWALFDLGFASGPQRLELLRTVADGPATTALDPVRTALGHRTCVPFMTGRGRSSPC